MISPTLFLGAAALLVMALSMGLAYAFSEGDVVRLDQACRIGDRDACMRRDAAIHDRDHEAEWRRAHPEWYR